MIDLTRQPRHDPEIERRFVAAGLWSDDVLGDWLSDQADRNGADPAIMPGAASPRCAGPNCSRSSTPCR